MVHLDPIFWRAGWVAAPADEARRELAAVVARDRWILDGNFLAEVDPEREARFARADAVVFLDVPRRRCFRRVVSRLVHDRGRLRADLPAGCREGLDPRLLRWIWRYPTVDRPRVLALLAQVSDGTAVHHLRSPREVQRFLDAA